MVHYSHLRKRMAFFGHFTHDLTFSPSQRGCCTLTSIDRCHHLWPHFCHNGRLCNVLLCLSWWCPMSINLFRYMSLGFCSMYIHIWHSSRYVFGQSSLYMSIPTESPFGNMSYICILGDIWQGYCMSTIMVGDKCIIKHCAVPHHCRLSMDPNTVWLCCFVLRSLK